MAEVRRTFVVSCRRRDFLWPSRLPRLGSSFDKKMEYHTDILEKMNAVVTGDEVARGKPNPDIFIEAARRIGCDPKHCVVFEDS